MSNASRCLDAAARYRRLAELTKNSETRRAYGELARLWQEMAAPAESVDRRSDTEAKNRIYAMVDVIDRYRRRVA
jgi:hypothetical protein